MKLKKIKYSNKKNQNKVRSIKLLIGVIAIVFVIVSYVPLNNNLFVYGKHHSSKNTHSDSSTNPSSSDSNDKSGSSSSDSH